MKKSEQSSVADSVLKQIKGGRVAMHSKTYFVLLSVVSAGAVAASALLAAYALSIVFFWVRIQTADTMAWGARANLDNALRNFPWWTLFAAIGLGVLAVWLLKKQGRLYRYKTGTIIVVTVLAASLLGLGFSYLSIGGTHLPGQRQNTRHMQQRGPGWQRNK